MSRLLPLLLLACAPADVAPPERVAPDYADCLSFEVDPPKTTLTVYDHRERPVVAADIVLRNDCPTSVPILGAAVDGPLAREDRPLSPFPGRFPADASHLFRFEGALDQLRNTSFEVIVTVAGHPDPSQRVQLRARSDIEIVLLKPHLTFDSPWIRTEDAPIHCWSEPATVRVHNTGDADALIDDLFVRERDPTRFRVVSPPADAFPLHLPPGEFLDVAVSHRPPDEGETRAEILLLPYFSDRWYTFPTSFVVLGDGAARPRVVTAVDPASGPDALRIPLTSPADPDTIEVRHGGRVQTVWTYEEDPPAVRLLSTEGLPAAVSVSWRPTICVEAP